MADMNYFQAYSKETFASRCFGIKIMLATYPERPLADFTEAERRAVNQASDLIEAAMTEALNKQDTGRQKEIAKEGSDLVSLFTEPIFVEEIPNGYCSRACCKDKPWFVVTTKMGRIKIGWRKRVIEIDWADSVILSTAEKLFPSENVTKYDRLIHAWGVDAARRYIGVLESQAFLG